MKYGYLYYRKPMLENKKERPMNLGDPIQSLAAIEILKSIGIPKEDIIPVDRYDLATYEGEEVVLLINGIESYEHYAYHTNFLPVSPKIIPVFASISLHREISEKELMSFREHQPIGCRDEYTVSFLKKRGIDAFLMGCLTLTFPKRQYSEHQNKIFLVDCANSVKSYIPEDLKQKVVTLSQIIKIKSVSETNRLTDEETNYFFKTAQNQLNKWRDEAAMVITSRLHVATPCAAMGIPVILAKDILDGRFGFIDRFLPLYTPEKYSEIDWSPSSTIPEEVKKEIIFLCKTLIDLAVSRSHMKKIYQEHSQEIVFCTGAEVAVQKMPFKKEERFTYAIWGVCLPYSYLLYEAMQEWFCNAKLVCAIDTWARGTYKDDIPIISPEHLEKDLPEDTVILVAAGAAHKDAVKRLTGKFRYILLKGTQVISHIL